MGRESRGRGLPLPFGAVRHIFRNPPKNAWFDWYSHDLMVGAACCASTQSDDQSLNLKAKRYNLIFSDECF
jgi:hypothetical protein